MSDTNKAVDNKSVEDNKSTAIVNYPFTVKKTVTIKPKQTASILPETGMLGNSAEHYSQRIGGAFAGHGSTLPLGRNALTKEEEAAWFPSVLGISTNHQDWDKSLNSYWNNLSVPVPLEGLVLNCNLTYHKSGDVGTPENVVHYILYKYCLIYGDVANVKKDINKSPRIRFYLWTKEEDVKLKLTKQALIDKATFARFAIKKTPEKAKSLIVLFNREVPKEVADFEILLAELQTNEPAKFLKLSKDESLLDKAFIQRCINKGLLKRPLNSEIIMYNDVVIGNSFIEAVVWLNQEENSTTKASLQSHLKITR